MELNEIPKEFKEWIDNATYEDMLRRNRFGPLGDPIFLNETGQYFGKVMTYKKSKLSPQECVEISKQIGWVS